MSITVGMRHPSLTWLAYVVSGAAAAGPQVVEKSCWASPEAEAGCCNGSSSELGSCWDQGRTFEVCCHAAHGVRVGDVLAACIGAVCLLTWCLRDVTHRRQKHRENELRRYQRVDALQRNLEVQPAGASPGGHSTDIEDSSSVCEQPRTEVESPKAQESFCTGDTPPNVLELHTPGADMDDWPSDTCDGGGADGGDSSLEEAAAPAKLGLLECGEVAFVQVLGALDGKSLARFESVSRWHRVLQMASLAGIWRLVHVTSFGGCPPPTLARPPVNLDARTRKSPWKFWWRWRQDLLAHSDGAQLAACHRLSEHLVKLVGEVVAEAQVQPMKPHPHWLDHLLDRLGENLGLDFRHVHDPRLAPLEQRWHCHAVVGAEAIVADHHGWHQDHVRAFVSCSSTFAALQGQPRLFLAVVLQSAADETWKIEVVHCPIALRAFASWINLAEEIMSFITAGRDFAAAFSGASRLARFLFYGPGWQLRECDLAPSDVFTLLHKELFGRQWQAEQANDMAVRVLQWLLAALCPCPFNENMHALGIVSKHLGAHLAEETN